jgi:hypothetical protein
LRCSIALDAEEVTGRGVPLAGDQDAVEEFATEAADEAFGDRVGTRRLHRCLDGESGS